MSAKADIFNFYDMSSKTFKYILLSFVLLLYFNTALWWVVDLWSSVWWWKNISDISVNPIAWWDALEKIINWALSILHTVKVILSWVFLIYLVFLGFQMVMAMWADDKLSASKRQIYYTLLAFLFVNIPWQLYSLFIWKVNGDVTEKVKHSDVIIKDTDGNIFVNFFEWNSTIEWWVIAFIKVIVIWVVIMLFMMAWIWLISSWWNDEKRKKARTRFLNWIIWLIFLWVIQSWVAIVYDGKITEGQTLFAKISNLAIFFTWPVAIFFLILWGFYYITSAWDEAKTKKWIAIIKNTFIAVIILIACYAFLMDLKDFVI